MESDFYQILGVNRNAGQEEIKARYDFLILAFHPDRFRNNQSRQAEAEAAAKAVNEAYQHLSKPEARAKYDRNLSATRPSSEHSLHEQISEAKARIAALEGELREEKRKAAAKSSKQQAPRESEFSDENAELRQRIRELTAQKKNLTTELRDLVSEQKRQADERKAEKADLQRQLNESHDSVQRLSLESVDLKHRVKELAAKNNKLFGDLQKQISDRTEDINAWAVEKADLQQVLDAFHASIQRLTSENIGYRNKTVDLTEEIAQTNRAAQLEQAQIRCELATAIQEVNQLKIEQDQWRSRKADLADDSKQRATENEQLNLQLEALRTSAQQLASDYEMLKLDYGIASAILEQTTWKSKSHPQTWLKVPTSPLSKTPRIAMAVVILAVWSLAFYLVAATQSHIENLATALVPQFFSSPESLPATTKVAEIMITTADQPESSSAIPTSLPTETFTASPTPMPTSTPTPRPTPTATLFTYPTIAYNYDTRRGEGWEDYKRSILGLPILWTGTIVHLPWFGEDISVDVGQNNGWRDVTLELGDSQQRELLEVGNEITFRAVLKSVEYSFGLETRLSEVEILEVSTPTPTPTTKADD